MSERDDMKITINRQEYNWNDTIITGAQIKSLCGLEGVINHIQPSGKDDPEITDNEVVTLTGTLDRFVVRNPRTAAS